MKPHQIISLMTFDGADNTLSLPDHDDHIHVGFQPLFGDASSASSSTRSLKPGQWIKLIDRLGPDRQPDRAHASRRSTRSRFRQAGQQGPRGRVALFGFVQLEFPWALGPPDGRYVLRGHAGETEHVLVVSTLGAPERRLAARPPRRGPARPRRRRSPPRARRSSPRRRSATEAAAERWLRAAGEAEVEEAVAMLNRVLHMQRAAAADAYVREVRREQALVVRVGYGEGEEVADGRWAEALELPARAPAHAARRRAAPAGAPRRAARRPRRRAGLRGARAARAPDLDAGRRREAALQLERGAGGRAGRARAVGGARRPRRAPGRAARPARRGPGRGRRPRCRAASTTRTMPTSRRAGSAGTPPARRRDSRRR